MKFYIAKTMLCCLLVLIYRNSNAQGSKQIIHNNEQYVRYVMNIDFNDRENKFTGYQKVVYGNTSQDTLNNIFYHLFYNAFQPGSAMQNRGRYIMDQDRPAFTIQELKPDECGYEQIDSVKMNGVQQPFVINGTILKINSLKPVLPADTVTIELWFKSQVPKMLIRTGRNNNEQVGFTMTQWYPKIAAYDRAGWHANQYIRREFYGPFADFEVNVRINKKYTVAATGILANANEIKHGYQTEESATAKNNSAMLTWKFNAKQVIDFAWAADTTYQHNRYELRKGLDLHLFYKPNTASVEDWETISGDVKEIFNWMEKKVGLYPYPQYSLVQGGSGGTEYPMLSMILGHRPQNRGMVKGYPIITLAVHEIMHNWWYSVVANDENRTPWLDEGFASFFQYEFEDYKRDAKDTVRSMQMPYERLLPPARKKAVEPMNTPADYYEANWGYDGSVYHKGAIFLNQLRYIVGEEFFWKGIQKYYHNWAFAHPDGDDFIKCMEQASGMQLKWYLDLWTKTTKTIDYAVGKVQQAGNKTEINLLRKGEMPMPLDIRILLSNDTWMNYTIPLVEMNAAKNEPGRIVTTAWSSTSPEYKLIIPVEYNAIKTIEIDPLHILFDLDKRNNKVML